MTEIYKPIIDYPNYYVSNLGNVKSTCYNQDKILSKHKEQNGYYTVCSLCKNNTQKRVKIHRLVAQAFIPNPNNYPVVNHKDENKSNNCVDNLEWCTKEYNINYGTHNQRSAKKVLNIDLNIIYNSLTEAANFDYNKVGNISACCKGKQTTAYGYHWKFI